MNTQNDFNLYTEFFQHKKNIITPVFDHSHKCCEFSLIVKGKGYVVIDGTSYDFVDNTIIITPPNAVHSFYGTIEENIYFGFYYKGIEKISTAVYIADDSFALLMKALHAMEYWYNRSGNNSIQIINSYSKIIIDHYFRNRVPSSKSISISFEKAIQYIDSHFNTDIKSEQIAQLSGYSYHHFRHEFKKNFHVTIKEYINEMRIMNAKYLLRLTSHSIKYIALECGFSTSAYFVTAFKQSVGISPLEYRNRKNTNIEKYTYIPYETEETISQYEKSTFWNAIIKQKPLDFKCDGVSLTELPFSKTAESVENILTNHFQFDNGLSITQFIRQYPEFDVIKWENIFQATKSDSPMTISDVVDCECLLPFSKSLIQNSAYHTLKNEAILKTVRFPKNYYEYAFENSTTIQLNDKISFSSCSKDGSQILPFFSISKNGEGFFVAIGWSGKWNCEISMTEEGFIIKAFIDDSSFTLLNEECIRTASVYVMRFQNDKIGVNNKLRRFLLSKIYSYIPSDHNDRLLFQYPISKEKDLPDIAADISAVRGDFDNRFVCVFCDYEELFSEEVIQKVSEISKIAHENEKKLSVYLTNNNAARSRDTSPLQSKKDYKSIANIVRMIHMDSIRADFGDLISYYSAGTGVIKTINTIYSTIHMLKNEFPALIFENCSGEKNHITLDIEMLSRCTPIWSYPLINCDWVLSKYLPIICCNATPKNDLNALLYSISPMLSFHCDGGDKSEYRGLKDFCDLYKVISPFFHFDFYHISILPKHSDWIGVQFHDIKKDEGIALVSRKTTSCVSECRLFLKNLNINKTYRFESAGGNSFEITAKSSYEAGISITIKKPETTQVWFYRSTERTKNEDTQWKT